MEWWFYTGIGIVLALAAFITWLDPMNMDNVPDEHEDI